MGRENLQLTEESEKLPIFPRSEEELKIEEQKVKESLYPKKISKNLWRFYVHGFTKSEIYVFDKLPVADDLRLINLSPNNIRRYIKHKNYHTSDGRCKDFKDNGRNIIIVSIHDIETLIQNIAVASHEFNHCAHRLLEAEGDYTKLIRYEESHCYIQDWLLETYLTIQIGCSVFDDLYKSRDLLWFHVITHN